MGRPDGRIGRKGFEYGDCGSNGEMKRRAEILTTSLKLAESQQARILCSIKLSPRLEHWLKAGISGAGHGRGCDQQAQARVSLARTRFHKYTSMLLVSAAPVNAHVSCSLVRARKRGPENGTEQHTPRGRTLFYISAHQHPKGPADSIGARMQRASSTCDGEANGPCQRTILSRGLDLGAPFPANRISPFLSPFPIHSYVLWINKI